MSESAMHSDRGTPNPQVAEGADDYATREPSALGAVPRGRIQADDRLFVVLHSADGEVWSMVQDSRSDRLVPAAYVSELSANERRDDMAASFPDHQYRVDEYRATSW